MVNAVIRKAPVVARKGHPCCPSLPLPFCLGKGNKEGGGQGFFGTRIKEDPTQGKSPSLPAGWNTGLNNMVSKAQNGSSLTGFTHLCPSYHKA